MFSVTQQRVVPRRFFLWMLALAVTSASTWLAQPVAAQQDTTQSEQENYWGITVTLKQAPTQGPSRSRPMQNLLELVPELDAVLTQNGRGRRIVLDKVYHVNVDGKTVPAVEGLLHSLRANPLVASATINPGIVVEDASGKEKKPFADPKARSYAYPAPDWDTSTSYTDTQRKYLGPFNAPAANHRIGGVDVDAVRHVRGSDGSDGSDVRIFLFSEYQWNTDHPNLPQPFTEIKYPWSADVCLPAFYSNHFNQTVTPMLGILAARDKGFGIVGVVPKAEVGIVEFPPAEFGPNAYGAQFQKLLAIVKPGDVVMFDTRRVTTNLTSLNDLIPADACPPANVGTTRCTIPRERLPEVASDIEALTNKGVHVIVDAGWGGINLDNPAWNGFFDRRLHDSGAIYVGAVDAATGARRTGSNAIETANYGSRIDLAGWYSTNYGTIQTVPLLMTTDYDSKVTNYAGQGRGYTRSFSALNMPLVAGVVALVQSVANADGLGPIPPKEMRELLVKTGRTLPHNDPSKPIGKFPDANAAVQELLKEHAEGVLEGALKAPGIVKAGQAVTLTAEVTDPKKGTLTYAWTKPEGFIGDTPNSHSITLTPPQVDKETVKVAQVTVTSSSGQRITLSKPLLIETAPLSGTLTGPETIASGASATFIADVAHAPTATVTYNWSLPAGFTSHARNTREITVTAPSVTAATPASLAVIAAQGAANSVALYKDVIVQPAAAPSPSDPGAGGSCHEAWSANKAYATAGETVTFNGKNYKNKWWTQGEDPASVGQWGVWEEVGECARQ